MVNTSVIWESRGQRTLFGPRGVSGLVNVEITPELCVRLASAYATTLRKGVGVTTSRDVSRAARALKRAVHGALNASAINVVDLEAQPLPVARFETARGDVRRRHRAAHHARATRSPSTSSSWTPAAPTCPSRRSASWSGSSPGRSTGGPSPARSPS